MTLAPAAESMERVSFFKVLPTNKEGAIRIHGQDYIGTLLTPSTVNPGTNIANYLLNPLAPLFGQTRLQAFGQLYEKYIFKRLKFHYSPAVPTSELGQIVISYDRDVADATPEASQKGIHEYLAMAGARTTSVWKPLTIDCPLTDTQDFFYTGYAGVGDMRLAYQGQLYVANVVNTAVNKNIGSIWVEYDCILMDPQLESLATEGGAVAGSSTTNGAANAAWNGMLAKSLAPAVGNLVFGVDNATGNSCFTAQPGLYQLMQTIKNSSGNITFNPPGYIPLQAGQTVTVTPIDSANCITSSGGFRLDQLLVPTGGAKIFGNVSNGITIGGFDARIFGPLEQAMF
jgi:hypothetical protein